MENDVFEKSEIKSIAKTEFEIVEPKLYNVIFHNDDVTPFNFVIYLLIEIFHETQEVANKLTMNIHETGAQVVGTFTREIAMEKVDECQKAIDINKFPLKVTCQEEE